MKKSNYKICHLTSVHNQADVRIFLKECRSLTEKYEVSLIAVNGEDGIYDGVNVINAKVNYSGRLQRFKKAVDGVFKKAVQLDCDLYHFHDPELLRIALKLKRRGKKVIYDVHEDLPRQIMSKYWIPVTYRRIVSSIVEKYENYVSRQLDAVVAATPYIHKRFEKINSNAVLVNNFPLSNEIDNEHDWSNKEDKVCFIGGISKIRGIEEIVSSFDKQENVKFELAGEISPPELKTLLSSTKGWQNTNYLNVVNRARAMEIKKRSFAGLVTFLPAENHINAQPNKIFEYMGAGLPIIASNFPLWKSLVEDNGCGICVDPSDPVDIKKAIDFLYTNPDKAKEMGARGLKLVQSKYNWTHEKEKLFNIYHKVLNN